jgi:hypothetical protein
VIGIIAGIITAKSWVAWRDRIRNIIKQRL